MKLPRQVDDELVGCMLFRLPLSRGIDEWIGSSGMRSRGGMRLVGLTDGRIAGILDGSSSSRLD